MVQRGESRPPGGHGREQLWDLAERIYPDDDPVPVRGGAADAASERRLVALGIVRATAKTYSKRTELRLALVCYGGVSLAVYMHGVTKELHKLVRASREFERLGDADPNPFDGERYDSEHAYFDALRELDRTRDRRLSVNVDVIAGTSAGGINGVVLAKTLARNVEQESLKRLWIDEGDLEKLLRTDAPGGWRAKAVFAVLRQLRHLHEPTSPLKGERMSVLLGSALEEMDDGGPVRRPDGTEGDPTLMPRNGELELFVTMTDLDGFEVLVPSGAGGALQRDRFHAQVAEFRADRQGSAGFGREANAALGFAARATSSFPGAFAPVSPRAYVEESGGGPPFDLTGLFRYSYDPVDRGQDAWFADGGILDNAPFDHVIDAIKSRRAESEVVRRLIYIQPDPGRPLTEPAVAGGPHPAPGWLPGLVKSVVGVKGSHSILTELLKLRDMNHRIGAVAVVVELQQAQVEAEIRTALALTQQVAVPPEVVDAAAAVAIGSDAVPTGVEVPDYDWLAALGTSQTESLPKALERTADLVRLRATQVLRPSWAAYERLKADSVAEGLADLVGERFSYAKGSIRDGFVRAALTAWARRPSDRDDPDSFEIGWLLGAADLGYRERRMQLLLAGVNGLYGQSGPGAPSRRSLDGLKSEAWNRLEALRSTPRAIIAGAAEAGFLAIGSADPVLLERPTDYAAEHAAAFKALFGAYRDALVGDTTIRDGATELWAVFQEHTDGWATEHQRLLLSRYLGFPMWDALIFPIISLSEIPQFTPIRPSQFSPVEVGALRVPESTTTETRALASCAAPGSTTSPASSTLPTGRTTTSGAGSTQRSWSCARSGRTRTAEVRTSSRACPRSTRRGWPVAGSSSTRSVGSWRPSPTWTPTAWPTCETTWPRRCAGSRPTSAREAARPAGQVRCAGLRVGERERVAVVDVGREPKATEPGSRIGFLNATSTRTWSGSRFSSAPTQRAIDHMPCAIWRGKPNAFAVSA